MKGPCRLFAVMLGVGVVPLLCAAGLRADVKADYDAAGSEMSKPVAQQNAALIEQKLASCTANPDGALEWFYLSARKMQITHHLQMMTAPLTPENSQKIAAECLAAIADCRRYFITPACKDAQSRLLSFTMQAGVARLIPDPTVSFKAQSDVVDALVQDLSGFIVNDPGRTADEKQKALQAAAGGISPYLGGKLRFATLMKIHDMILALDTPGAREAYVSRAQIKIADGQTEEGLKDLAAAVADPRSSEDVRNLARCRRMQALSSLQRWTDAAADADAILALSVAKSGGRLFGSGETANAKLDALRVRQALGQLGPEAVPVEMGKVLLELLCADGISAEEKSKSAAGVLMAISNDAGCRGQWEKAAGLARAAYNIAPNSEVPATVKLIQQLLANRTRYSAGGGFSAVRSADDLAKARAFFARQSGTKTVGDRTVALKADLSNDTDFPRTLDALPTAFDGDVKTGIEKLAASCPDLQSRALAQGLLNQPDAAIATMAWAVTALGLESPKTSDAVNFTARFVRAKLESVALANAFLQSQIYGPAGKDGVMGTADDAPNPLAPNAGASVPK